LPSNGKEERSAQARPDCWEHVKDINILSSQKTSHSLKDETFVASFLNPSNSRSGGLRKGQILSRGTKKCQSRAASNGPYRQSMEK
jgi:hypothetical protein